MNPLDWIPERWATLRLRRVRAWAVRRHGRVLAVVIAFHYSLISMLASGMLLFTSTDQPLSVYWVNGAGEPFWWNYPVIVIFTPNAILAFPIWLTLGMLGVAFGLGLAVAAAANLLWDGRRAGKADGAASAGPMPPTTSLVRDAAVAPAVAALVALATGCGADFAVGGLALLGGSAAIARSTLTSVSLVFAILDLGLMTVSLAVLETSLRAAESLTRSARPGRRASGPGSRPHRTRAGDRATHGQEFPEAGG